LAGQRIGNSRGVPRNREFSTFFLEDRGLHFAPTNVKMGTLRSLKVRINVVEDSFFPMAADELRCPEASSSVSR
jgi:hypothetical protein